MCIPITRLSNIVQQEHPECAENNESVQHISTSYQITFLARLFRTFANWPEEGGGGRSISIPPSGRKEKKRRGIPQLRKKRKKEKIRRLEELGNWPSGSLKHE